MGRVAGAAQPARIPGVNGRTSTLWIRHLAPVSLLLFLVGIVLFKGWKQSTAPLKARSWAVLSCVCECDEVVRPLPRAYGTGWGITQVMGSPSPFWPSFRDA